MAQATHQKLPTILIVEDERLSRIAAVDCLEQAGYRVLEAATFEQATDFLSEGESIDLLFTDIRLGGTRDG